MLELKLKPEESHFLHGLEAMLHLVDVASLDCSRAGLKLRAVHPKHIGVIALHFDANDFQKYSCDEVLSMGIPIDDMVEVIRRADKDDTIAITVGDENLETITISFESPSQMNNTVTCELPLVDGSSHRFKILDWQDLKPKYQAFVQMPPVEFMRACKSLVNIDGDGHIMVTDQGLKFFASGKSGRVNIMYMQPATDVTYSMEAPVSLTFDMKYLYSVAKACTPFDQVEICLSTTQLLIVQCKIKQMGYIKFYLSPKVKRETEINGSGEEDKWSAESSGNEEGSAATLLELKLEKESLFFMGLEAMLHLVDVGSIDCSSTGLKILVVDPEHIAVFALLCPAKDFQLYRCNKVLSMGIPINDMVKAIDCAHKDDTITICCKNLHTITISFESPNQNNTTTYDLPVVDDSGHHVSSHCFNMDWQNVKPKYQAFVHMPSAEFMRVLKCLSNICGDGDGHISVTNKGLKFFASGKSGCVNIKYKQSTVVTWSMGAPVSLALDMKYMYSIAKASTLFDKVVICLTTTEVMVECKISQTGYIRFFLAPKVIIETEFAEILEGQQKRKKSRICRRAVQEGSAATMLELKLNLVMENLFLKVLEAMLDLFDVINVDCSRTGLKLQAVDTDDITIVELFISVEDLKDYDLYDEDLSVGIPIDDLVKAIRCADEGDTITIKVDDEYFNTIALSLETPKDDTTYDVRVVDADDLFYIPDGKVSDSNYQAIVQMPSAEFMRVCKYLSNKGSDGHISVTEDDGLMFSTYGKYGDVNIRYIKTEKVTTATDVTYNMQAPVSLTLDLKCMYNIAKVSALLGQVKISLSTMHPLMIECKMGKMSYMRYFMAPKVEEKR